jgi:hypothetical protein
MGIIRKVVGLGKLEMSEMWERYGITRKGHERSGFLVTRFRTQAGEVQLRKRCRSAVCASSPQEKRNDAI